MELKLLANTEPRKRFHLIRRLRNAAGHADSLEKLCQGELCDARTKLEAQVIDHLHVSVTTSKILLFNSSNINGKFAQNL